MPNRQSDFVCLYCGSSTTIDKSDTKKELANNPEHLFPYSMGGKETLELGDVCNKCNNRLSTVDRAFKHGNILTAHAYQVDGSKKGRPRSPEDRKRHKEEKIKITLDNKSSSVVSIPGGGACFTNSNHAAYVDMFVRAVHKCASNILCKYFGSKSTRLWYPELIDFVNTGRNPHSWSYAASYQLLHLYQISPQVFYPLWAVGMMPSLIEPQPIHGKEPSRYLEEGFVPFAVSFIDTSGIYLVGTLPDIITKPSISFVSKYLSEQIERESRRLDPNGDKLLQTFDSSTLTKERSTIGDLNFLWIKKQRGPSDDPSDKLLVLVSCRICGQKNPTGHHVDRRMVNTQMLGQLSYSPGIKSWNKPTLIDLKDRGLKTEKYPKEKLNEILTGRLYYSTKHCVEFLPEKGEIRCINCGHHVSFGRKDCFL